MICTSSKQLNFAEFITQYGDNTSYELIDGELRDMQPNGVYEAVAGSIAGRIYSAFQMNEPHHHHQNLVGTFRCAT
ncbi:hypothetical protein [Okeania sp.]|uniref:hypothetical protein n=1 Tax=Okeania sp. TaxID=3100323 RepID=UPI002B4AD651|nr:hypothetical protein [Okeania sp.]MEB3340665.1 hypothetical protein [Okeania sp.]